MKLLSAFFLIKTFSPINPKRLYLVVSVFCIIYMTLYATFWRNYVFNHKRKIPIFIESIFQYFKSDGATDPERVFYRAKKKSDHLTMTDLGVYTECGKTSPLRIVVIYRVSFTIQKRALVKQQNNRSNSFVQKALFSSNVSFKRANFSV